MLISNLQGKSSPLTDLARSSTVKDSADDTFGGSFIRLVSSAESGDATGGQPYSGNLEEQAVAATRSNPSMQQVLSEVRSALSAGDIPAAEAALSTLQVGVSSAPVSAYPLIQSAVNAAESAVSELGTKVLTIFSAITSGDLQSAQSTYGSLADLLPQNGSFPTYSMDPQGGTVIDFDSLRSNVESAFSSGNVGSAEAAMQAFVQEFSAGSIIRTVA